MKLLWQLGHTKLAYILVVVLELLVWASSLSSEINDIIMVELSILKEVGIFFF
jgi:hypothetical protein